MPCPWFDQSCRVGRSQPQSLGSLSMVVVSLVIILASTTQSSAVCPVMPWTSTGVSVIQYDLLAAEFAHLESICCNHYTFPSQQSGVGIGRWVYTSTFKGSKEGKVNLSWSCHAWMESGQEVFGGEDSLQHNGVHWNAHQHKKWEVLTEYWETRFIRDFDLCFLLVSYLSKQLFDLWIGILIWVLCSLATDICNCCWQYDMYNPFICQLVQFSATAKESNLHYCAGQILHCAVLVSGLLYWILDNSPLGCSQVLSMVFEWFFTIWLLLNVLFFFGSLVVLITPPGFNARIYLSMEYATLWFLDQFLDIGLLFSGYWYLQYTLGSRSKRRGVQNIP